MKRSALKRSQKPIPKKRSKPRRGPMRDAGYLRWLHEKNCAAFVPIICQLFRRESSHGPVNGMSQKGPDSGAILLCGHHHREQHRIGWPAFEAKYGFSRAEKAAGLYAEYLKWRERK
jgi:hypothetical protein